MPYSDDPVRDFEQHDREQAKRLDELPKCDICGEPIQDEFLFYIDGFTYCEKCMNEHFRKSVDDYVK